MNILKISTLILTCCIPLSLLAAIHDFETTRLKSTAGAGVASILMDEATLLNPAPLAFFNVSSIYVQKSGMDIESQDPSNLRTGPRSGQFGVIASDSKSGIKGSVSYQKQDEGFNQRKRFGFSGSSLVGKKSALGVTYRHTKDRLSENGYDLKTEKYKQFIGGVSHAISPNVTLGMVIVDPFKAKKDDTIALVGAQYVYDDFISIMGDLGADYNENLSDSLLVRAASQLRIYNDFYLRFGFFNDKNKSEKGTGVGLGWVQPKLVLEVAMKNTTVSENKEKLRKDEKIKETAFSLSYRF